MNAFVILIIVLVVAAGIAFEMLGLAILGRIYDRRWKGGFRVMQIALQITIISLFVAIMGFVFAMAIREHL